MRDTRDLGHLRVPQGGDRRPPRNSGGLGIDSESKGDDRRLLFKPRANHHPLPLI